MKKVYQLLREYRESKGITQTYIAKKLEKSTSRISAIENGGLRLTVDEFIEICIKGYEINPNIFLNQLFSESENSNTVNK